MLRLPAIALALALCAASCVGSTAEPEPRTLACPDDEAEILRALRSGLPTYDYDPAPDMQGLIERTDVLLIASLDGVRRVEGADVDATVFELSAVDIVAGPDRGSIEQFATDSTWALRDEPDPIGATVTILGMTVLAALEVHPPSPRGYRADVQGIHVTCDPTVPGSEPIIGPMPGAQSGRPLDDVAEAVRALGS